ncbi:hypothetical protein BDV24DRAFT_104848 [Aspergillus arachidicola]|uniref:Uncharacterized protein n=1 Tax=Aspergillus arachidicola TaxID=656916 RepID=A0A5N6XZL8_9EURO|nr:hypothetical protein BDV24DRAFT_104848 [Aspergillus arachidicola]
MSRYCQVPHQYPLVISVFPIPLEAFFDFYSIHVPIHFLFISFTLSISLAFHS